MPHWLRHTFGVDNGNDPVYLFYSGLFTVLVFAGGQWASYRHKQCHEPWCPRVGRVAVDDRGTLSCWVHHPDGKPERGHIHRRYHGHGKA